MSIPKCMNCFAPFQPDQIECAYCGVGLDTEAARNAVRCPKCQVLNASTLSSCRQCKQSLVQKCIFCSANSSITANECSACGEAFSGAKERKAKEDAGERTGVAEVVLGVGGLALDVLDIFN